jgi:hypothetical protein
MNFLHSQSAVPELGRSISALAAIQRAYGCRCNSAVFFLNSHCLRCDTALGYEPELGQVFSLAEGAEPGLWLLAGPSMPAGHTKVYRRCANLETAAACNWLVPANTSSPWCIACRLNRTVPSLTSSEDGTLWRRIEAAKRRVVSALVGLGLPLESRDSEDPEHGLAFDFLRSPANGPRVLTGHENGVITLNIEEADDVTREQMRTSMHEPYRTLVGHFRHEVGHYYWDRLVAKSPYLEGFRNLFGDERADYAEALRINYTTGSKPQWWLNHVSAYASVHPWEDWAETWAHYMHMVDTLSTAASFDLQPEAMSLPFDCFGPDVLYRRDSPGCREFLSILNSWLKLAAVMNELCRSMGQPDFYPFALSGAAVTKIHFVHMVVCDSSRNCDRAETSELGRRC